MVEQLCKTYKVSTSTERNEMENYINAKIKEGWFVKHIAASGGRSFTNNSDTSTAPTFCVIYERELITYNNVG